MLSFPFRQCLAGLLVISLIMLPPPTRALFGVGDIVFDPSNYAENVVTAARALQSNINEAMEIANQLRQIEMEVKNLARLPEAAWGSVQSDLNRLREIAQSASGISSAMQTLSGQFKQIYPGYRAPTNYEQQYQEWTGNSLKGIHQALEAATDQIQHAAQKSVDTQKLLDQSTAADGQLQALQAGNMIALKMVGGLQELQHLQALEMQAQNTYLAGQVQDDAAEKAAIKKWFDSGKNHKPFM